MRQHDVQYGSGELELVEKHVSVPSVLSGIKYSIKYWAMIIKNLSSDHTLDGTQGISYRTTFLLDERLKKKWADVYADFCDTKEGGNTPYLYSQSAGTVLYVKLLTEYGINFKKILQIKHQINIVDDAEMNFCGKQFLSTSMIEIFPAHTKKVVLTLKTEINNKNGKKMADVFDTFLVKDVPIDIYNKFGAVGISRKMYDGLRKREMQLFDVDEMKDIYLPMDLGRKYGVVSGDMNPVHTTPALAALFGNKKIFAQGLCIRNLVISALTQMGKKIQTFDITFCNRAYLGEHVNIRCDDARFEVVDRTRRVIAFGQFGNEHGLSGISLR